MQYTSDNKIFFLRSGDPSGPRFVWQWVGECHSDSVHNIRAQVTLGLLPYMAFIQTVRKIGPWHLSGHILSVDIKAKVRLYTVSAQKGGWWPLYGQFSYTMQSVTIKLRMVAFIWTVFLHS